MSKKDVSLRAFGLQMESGVPSPAYLKDFDMKAAGLLGWLIFGLSTLNCIATYGRHWDFSGKYHMPTALLAPNGQTYRDGAEVNFVTLALVRNGIEQEVMLAAVGIPVAICLRVMIERFRAWRRRRQAAKRELRRLRAFWTHY